MIGMEERQDTRTDAGSGKDCKVFGTAELGIKKRPLSSVDNSKKPIRPAGLEPAASGLGNRRSIRLSYGRDFLQLQ